MEHSMPRYHAYQNTPHGWEVMDSAATPPRTFMTGLTREAAVAAIRELNELDIELKSQREYVRCATGRSTPTITTTHRPDVPNFRAWWAHGMLNFELLPAPAVTLPVETPAAVPAKLVDAEIHMASIEATRRSRAAPPHFSWVNAFVKDIERRMGASAKPAASSTGAIANALRLEAVESYADAACTSNGYSLDGGARVDEWWTFDKAGIAKFARSVQGTK